MSLAVLAGSGALPGAILKARPGLLVRFAGVPCDTDSDPVLDARFEKLGGLFADLRAQGVTELCLAGAMRRPALDPAQFDAETMALMPRILPALQGGDDGLLSTIIAIFEEQGFTVRGAHDLLPDLVADAGVLSGTPSERDVSDVARGRAILMALGPEDVGQGCVVAAGLCLGVETVQGTDAMLRFVGDSRSGFPGGGVFVKCPKPGQDLRVDMPTIGPDTVRAAAAAGLTGICVAAGGVILLDREALLVAARELGVAVWAI